MSIFSRRKKPMEPPPPITYPHIRWMIRRDFPAVLSIEKDVFEFPWEEKDFLNCLRQRNCIGLVIEDRQGVVLGFIVYELRPSHLEIFNLAVRADFQRRQVGRTLIEKLVGKLSQERRSRILTNVRESNVGAQLFFRAAGFVVVNVLRHHYQDTDEDAYVFVYDIRKQPSTPTQPRGK